MTRKKQKLFGTKSLALLVATTCLAALLPLVLGDSFPFRAGVWAGVITSAIGSLAAFFLLGLSLERGVKVVMMALSAGLILRMVLVAAGLSVATWLGANLLAFCVGFFVVYIAHQTIEIVSLLVRRSSPPAEGET